MINIGDIVKDRYEIIAQLGKGGMSTVFLARDKKLGSYWAIKQVLKNRNVDIDAFKKEVELLASLNHVQIPRIVDRIDSVDSYCVCMDFIDGISLGKKVLAEGPQKENDVVKWAVMICDVLNYLHKVRGNPIIYCDMKPANLMLTKSGNIMLVDFGIAKECVRGDISSTVKIGTKGYASPEQYKGQALDERTDIYSLGTTLFNLVTGIEPKDPPNAIVPIRKVDTSLSEGLEYIINKCTEINPEKRYKNCNELKSDLLNIDKLNEKYKNKAKKKLIFFSTLVCLFCCFLIITLVGYFNIKRQIQNSYDSYYIKAVECEKSNQKEEAIENYKNAIELKPDEEDAYMRLFNIMLPTSEENYVNKTKNAVDVLKKYVDNKYSPIHNNTNLLFIIAKKSLDINETIYAGYAADYLEIIKESSEYKDNKIDKNEVDSLSVISTLLSRDISNINFNELSNSLEELGGNVTNNNNLDDNDKLNMYYTIMNIYSSNSSKLNNSYENIIKYGEKSRDILDDTLRQDEIKFTDTIPLYRLMASSLYSYGVSDNNIESKRNKLKESIRWFGYLELFNDNMPENLQIKKGGAYKEIVETYMSLEEKSNINSEIIEYVNKSAQIFNEVLTKNSNSFVAEINLIQVYIDMEKIKPEGSTSDYNNIKNEYKKLIQMKNTNSGLSKAELLQFNAVRESIEMLGLKESDFK